jgi:hypothetical protein
MQVRKLLVLTSVLALFVVAPGVALAKPGGSDRPIHGSGTATDTLDLATGTGSGEGPAVISHLGKGTFSHSFAVTLTGPTTFTVVSSETFTAANGDQLFATFAGGGSLTGVGVGETAHITGPITITGGTGRFADASGTLTGTFDAETLSIVGTTVVNRDTFSVEGRISY